ncbi:MAG: glycosyltransferase [Clostridiales bacterium]|nr:glycosyltransferase [Clostridiales bacterium]
MKVLIFTASAGNGHNSTARRLVEKIQQENPETKCEVVDIFKEYASKLKAWTMDEGYSLSCNHLLPIYNYFFKKSEKSSYENRDKSKCNKSVYSVMYGMLNKIYKYKPDLIISTYIFSSVALTNIKRHYKIPARIICMTLDYGISPYWECCASGLDYMFLSGDYMVKPFLEKGYKKEQLIVSGIPVADKFYNLPSKDEAREILELDKDKFTLIIMKASFFPISHKKIIKELSKIEQPIQIVIVNGKNPKVKNDMQKRLKKAKLKHKIINLGFTTKITEYFASCDLILGKAGGLSTTESINAGIPSLIIDKLPQQEIYNKDFLVNCGCAKTVNKRTIASTINDLMTNPKEYEKMKKSALKIRIEGTLDKFYDIISSTPQADYSDIIFNDNKKTVIKNIDRKRKQTIKEQKNKSHK